MPKPKTLKEYVKWAKKELGTDFYDTASVNLYNVNLAAALSTISNHPFMAQLPARTLEWQKKYKKQHRSELFMDDASLPLQLKPHASAVDKSFRMNVLWNERFPKEPENGWVTSNNIFQYFNDGIRGTLVSKFIDGPRYIINQLVKHARQCGVNHSWRSQAKDAGYYAYHFYTHYTVDFYDLNLNFAPATIRMEIQVTTQLQEIMRSLTHKFYESRRIQNPQIDPDWKWRFRENQFRASYLSHTLHLLEAYVVQSRDEYFEQKRRKGASNA